MPSTVKYLLIVGSLWLLAACGKYRLFDNLEVVEQTYTGLITVSKSGQDIDGVFEGTMDSGSYSFIWDNPSRGAVLYLELTAHSGGSVQLVFFDAKGNEVLQETRSAIGSDAFAIDGKRGKWKIALQFSAFEGSGHIDLNPIN